VAAGIGAAEAAETGGDRAAAVRIYERLPQDQAAGSGDGLSRLGPAAPPGGDRRRAAEAFARVYYEFPLTEAATAAAPQLELLKDEIVRTGYKLDMGRAQMVFGARRYNESRA